MHTAQRSTALAVLVLVAVMASASYQAPSDRLSGVDPFAMEAATHVYDDPGCQAAEERVETWMDDNCG